MRSRNENCTTFRLILYLSNRDLRYIISILIIFGSLSVNAQEGAYATMLDALYSETVPLISCGELSEKINSADLILLDVREKNEFQTSHIQGALEIGYEKFSLDLLKSISKDAQVIVYCSVGYRSEKIGERLLEAGFTKVNNLYGGIFQWVNNGLPIVKGAGIKTDSIHAYNKVWGLWLDRGIKVYE